MIFSKLIQLGSEHLPFSAANKVRMMNIVAIFTIVIASLYTLNYIFILKQPVIATINSLFVVGYSGSLILNHYRFNRGAKIWFFVLLMLHLVICTNLYVTNATGFHLYFFLVPTGAFLLFELHEKIEKIVLSLIAVMLYFYCENTLNTSPLLVLTDEMNHLIYQSVIFFNMVEVIVVLTLFNNQIEINETKLRVQAETDALTKLPNRHYFFEKGSLLLNSSLENNRPFSLALIDIDYFKSINDKYGHHNGDKCLKSIAALMQNTCKAPQFVARIGGEEFVVLLPECTFKEAISFADQLREKITQHSISLYEDESITCSASIGVASISSENQSLKKLLVDADKSLYCAKEQGRNRVYPLS